MKENRPVIKITLFVVICMVVFCGLSLFVQPVWKEWNNYDTIYGFYEQPENTIETVFLGASVTVNGIIPMQLYEEYGISAYNLGTEQQPMLISYYWLQEAYRLHPETLKTVVLDMSMLRRLPWKEFYRKAVDSMKWSAVKYNAVKAYSDSLNERFSYLIPLFGYHDRWADLGKTDFEKIGYEASAYTKGYNFSTEMYLDSEGYSKVWVPKSYSIYDGVTAREPIENEAREYCEKIIDFCKDKQIELILIKTPQYGWLASEHNTTQDIADSNGLEFIDFNYVPYMDEIDYNCAADNVDSDHMNYYGASKLTKWFGEYLTKECEVTDVRGNEKYDFMEAELEKYHKNVTAVVELKETDNLSDYLEKAITMENCTVLLALKRDASMKMTKEQRDSVAKLGLEKLAEITYGDSYVAVIEDGKVIEEQLQFWDSEAYENGEDVQNGKHISFTGTTKSNNKYTLISGGVMQGNDVSCIIDEKEYFADVRGMQAAVWNNEKEAIIDVAVFDLYASPVRVVVNEASLDKALEQGYCYETLPDELKNLYLYARRKENYEMAAKLEVNEKENNIYDFLDTYWGKNNYVIFASAGDVSYIAVINEGKVLDLQEGQPGELISAVGIDYEVISGKNTSLIKVKGTEYSMQEKGMNIIVYDSLLGEVVDNEVFDTRNVIEYISERNR